MVDAELNNLFNTASNAKWQEIDIKKRAGVLVPLFSMYSQNSLGIGDFADLKLVIDWAAKCGNSIVQLLPMNEVGATCCPYDSTSSFALEPMYISFEMLSGNKMKLVKARLEEARKMFPAGKGHVDYHIKQEKLNLLWEIYSQTEEKNVEEFQVFIDQNNYWLNDFALFKVLKKHHKGHAWMEWEDRYKDQDPCSLNDFLQTYEKEIIFHMWLQWQLYKQFKEVKEYAKKKNIFLKGDLPILVSMDSADVWAHPEFFKMEFASGAPPDMYCEKGQRWGMPTYNWDRIAVDEFTYLKEKLKYAENFYDILRIDHVVGLFRIWSIPFAEPLENKGLNGFFDPSDESKWWDHGRRILSVMLHNTKMLLCAEDLGVVPKACTDSLNEFGIPGNDVQRWVKDWQSRHDFLGPREYRSVAVSMLSTHDTTNWPAWWEYEAGTVDEALFIRKCRERGIDFNSCRDKLFDVKRSKYGRLRWLNAVPSGDNLVSILGKKREEIMDLIDMHANTFQEKEKLWKQFALKGPMREKADTEIISSALKVTLDSNAIFSIQLIIDWLYLAGIFKGNSYQYRINTPGTLEDSNWSLTMPVSLEELLKHEVNNTIKKMIVYAGRNKK